MKAGGQEPLEKAEAADISILTSPKPSSALDEPEAPRAVNATQVPVKVTKSSRDTGSSHRKNRGKDTTERSKKGKDKGKDQVTVTDKKRKRSTPQAVESKYKSSKDKSFHGSKRPRTSSDSLQVQEAIERSSNLTGPHSIKILKSPLHTYPQFQHPQHGLTLGPVDIDSLPQERSMRQSSPTLVDIDSPVWISSQDDLVSSWELFPCSEPMSGGLSGFVLRSSPIWERERYKSEFVMIKGKNSQQTSKGEEAELIIRKERAVCKLCFNIFEEDNVLKTKCTCEFTLIHEPCAAKWSQEKGNNKCNVCEEDIQNIPVTLSEYQSSDTNKKDKPKRFFGCFGSQGS